MNSRKKVHTFSVSYLLLIFLTFSLVYFLIAVYMQTKINRIKTEETALGEKHLLEVEGNILSSRIERLVSDVLYLTDRAEAQELSLDHLEKMKPNMIDFSNRKKIYNRIRILDPVGNKILRVNYDDSGSYIKASPDPVVSMDTPWFASALSLNKSHVYISRLDLDIKDNGELKKPLSPMIRVSAPVYEGKEAAGVLVADYSAKYLINEFRDIAESSLGHLMLLNTDGYYLINPLDRLSEFAFMCDDRQEISFKTQFPGEWKKMQTSESGQFQTDRGYFVYRNIVPYNGLLENGLHLTDGGFQLGEGNWIAVSYVSLEDQSRIGIINGFLSMSKYIIKQNAAFFAVILVLSLIISILFSMNKATRDRIRFFSECDMMTGVYNRRAGLVMLEKSYQEAGREQKHISICFIDINGLKEVNDHLGHSKGDELILSVVDSIKKTIRQSDYVIRLGGDEFLIVYPDASLDQAECIWKRAEAEYVRINDQESRPYVISVSHGVASVEPEVKKVIDELLNDADTNMYAEKRIKKDGLQVVRVLRYEEQTVTT